MTLSGLMKDCRKYLAMRSYADTTLNTYDERWDAFRAYLVHARLEDDVRSFTGETAMAYAVYLHDRGASGNTICGHLSALRTLAAYGMKTPRRKGSGMMLTADPTTAFDWPTRTQPETKYLLPDELRAFLAVEVPSYMALARDLLMETGLRASEACRLNVEHLREAGGRHFIAVTVKGRGTKERTREVPLSAELAGFIRAEVATRNRPDAPVLVGHDGERLTRTGLTSVIDRIGQRAGITRFRLSSHKLRHTANVIARFGGEQPLVRSRLLNHSSTRSLERYDHLLPGELHDARTRLGGALRRYIGAVGHEPEQEESRQTMHEEEDAG